MKFKTHKAVWTLVIILSGCIFGNNENKNPGLIGIWEYEHVSKAFGGYAVYTDTWHFVDSNEFQYRYLPNSKVTVHYMGEWKILGDTIKLYPKVCLEGGTNHSDSLQYSNCPDSSWGNSKLFWDGNTVFDFDLIDKSKRVYTKTK